MLLMSEKLLFSEVEEEDVCFNIIIPSNQNSGTET